MQIINKSIQNKIIWFGLLGLLLMIGNCSEPNPTAPSSKNVHAESFYNPQYNKTTEYFHGSYVLTEGTSSCSLCHGADLKGSENIPGCWECHFGPDGSKVPAGVNWTHGLDLHSGLTEYEFTCNSCHNHGRIYNAGPDSCHDCHGVGINHVLGQEWLDKNSVQFHGSASLADCSDCHVLTQKCYECHFGETGSRSPGAWIHGNNNAHENYEQFDTTCNQCHDLNRSYSYPPPSCHDCH